MFEFNPLFTMKSLRTLILFALTIGLGYNALAQEKINRFRFAGYKVVFVPSDVFRIEIGHPELAKQETKGDLFVLTVKDPEGKMPKDTVRIYTNSVRSIQMDYSELAMDKPMKVDSLHVSMGSSHGTVYVEADYLKVQAKAGSHVELKGTTRFLECNSKAHSSINKNRLKQTK